MELSAILRASSRASSAPTRGVESYLIFVYDHDPLVGAELAREAFRTYAVSATFARRTSGCFQESAALSSMASWMAFLRRSSA